MVLVVLGCAWRCSVRGLCCLVLLGALYWCLVVLGDVLWCLVLPCVGSCCLVLLGAA